MSDKRHRQQQRRERRKAQGRSRRSSAARGRPFPPDVRRLLAELAEITCRDAHEPADALEAEEWASSLIGNLQLCGDDGELLLPGFVDALAARADAPALAALCALSAVAAPDDARRARAAADQLAASGVREPRWAGGLGQARPTAAALLHENVFDDGVSVLVEFSAPGAEPHTVGAYVDHNLGGLVKDAFLAGSLGDVRAHLDRCAPEDGDLAFRDLDLAEARARLESALFMLDHTLGPPVDESVLSLRALIEARVRLLPAGFALADDFQEMALEQRDALLADFVGSPEGERWRGDADAEDIAYLAIDFGADYNHGGPLRWSPVVVEIFMSSWLARKVMREPGFLSRVPDVLRDWVAYAGRRRSVPAVALREAIAAVGSYREEMLGAATDRETWGAGKTLAMAALEAGVDLTDGEQLRRFIDRYNRGLAA
jgi:hypothetical protein